MTKVLLVLAALTAFTQSYETIRLSEPVYFDDKIETFGELFEAKDAPLSLTQVMQEAKDYEQESFVMKTEIAKVCQKKGCFFIARDGALAVRVAFKDYGFFIPTDAGGKTVVLKGQLVSKTLNEDQAAHFNKDMGGSDMFKAGQTYEIVASGITIPITQS